MSAPSRSRTITVQIEELTTSRFRSFSHDLPGFSWTFIDAPERAPALAGILANYCAMLSSSGNAVVWTGSGSRVDMAVASLNGQRIVAIEHFRINEAPRGPTLAPAMIGRFARRLRALAPQFGQSMLGRSA